MSVRVRLLGIQCGVVLLAVPVFVAAGAWLEPLPSFLAGVLGYWALALAGGTLLLVADDAGAASRLRTLFGRPRRPALAALAFVPPAAVLLVVFLPALPGLSPGVGLLVVGMALVNGLIEEVFWRGLTVAVDEAAATLTLSTLLFTGYHFVFLFLPISYDGGIATLVGGAAFMGALWVFVTVRARTVALPIVAHQLVNVFAFSGLAVLNGWG